MVTRRNSHIAVVLLPNLLPAGAGARSCWRWSISSRSASSALLAYFSVLIVERMQLQRMTVIDLPMSFVYGGIALGCFLMLVRQIGTCLAQRAGRAGASAQQSSAATA